METANSSLTLPEIGESRLVSAGQNQIQNAPIVVEEGRESVKEAPLSEPVHVASIEPSPIRPTHSAEEDDERELKSLPLNAMAEGKNNSSQRDAGTFEEKNDSSQRDAGTSESALLKEAEEKNASSQIDTCASKDALRKHDVSPEVVLQPTENLTFESQSAGTVAGKPESSEIATDKAVAEGLTNNFTIQQSMNIVNAGEAIVEPHESSTLNSEEAIVQPHKSSTLQHGSTLTTVDACELPKSLTDTAITETSHDMQSSSDAHAAAEILGAVEVLVQPQVGPCFINGPMRVKNLNGSLTLESSGHNQQRSAAQEGGEILDGNKNCTIGESHSSDKQLGEATYTQNSMNQDALVESLSDKDRSSLRGEKLQSTSSPSAAAAKMLEHTRSLSLQASGKSLAAQEGGSKTELEREMELFEAAEREEEARLLASLRFEQSTEVSAPRQSSPPVESKQGERKRAPETSMPEHRPKRGRKPMTHQAQKEEEDVCFVCFDGGNLLLCDKRSCPKAYHIECTGRESEFFQKRGQWFCGWHVCAHCSRSATMHCYTCPSAFCNVCVKDTEFRIIRKGRGLCEECYPIVHMIEHSETINAEGVQVDFTDRDTYECLFKEYWDDLKQKLVLTTAEFEKARKAKESEILNGNFDTEGTMVEEEAGSTDSDNRPRTRLSQLLKRKRMAKVTNVVDASESDYEEEAEEQEDDEDYKTKKGRTKVREFDGWASRELCDFIQSIKEDPKKPQSLHAVKNLLWTYVESNKLNNPRHRGSIICDERLQKLFGKKHVGRFEMMKLLSSHIAAKKSFARSSIDDDLGELLPDDNRFGRHFEKRKKSRKRSDESKHSKPDPSEYAAIDVKNINLIYLKRSLLDILRDDPDFENKVVGAFIRIRIPGMVNKSDTCYRLVQVIGVKQVRSSENPEKAADIILEILNLQKREEVPADSISSQDFTEEECQRLRQSFSYGFLKAMTVGELEEKAQALREVKVKDWFESELLKLSHLRDRASEKGRKKELRECVEKIQLLSSPEEKERQLNAPFEIKADPQMDPNYESEDDDLPPDDYQETQNRWERGSSAKPWEKSTNTAYNRWENDSFSEPGSKVSKPVSSNWNRKDHGKDNPDYSSQAQNQGWNSLHPTSNEQKNGWGDDSEGKDWNDGWNNEESTDMKDGAGWGDTVGEQEKKNIGWNDTGIKQVSTDKKYSGSWGDNAGSKEGNFGSRMHQIGTSNKDGGNWGDGSGSKEKSKGGWNQQFASERNDGWNNQGNADRRNAGGWGEAVRPSEGNDSWNKQGSFNGRNSGGWGETMGTTERNDGWNTQGNFDRRNSGGWGETAGPTEGNASWNSRANFPRRDGYSDRGYKPHVRPPFNQAGASNMGDIGSTDYRVRREYNAGTHGPPVQTAPIVAEVNNTNMVVDAEKEKIWYYQDPTKTIQGPFSMEQLRKWEKTKLFPLDLRIWRKTESQNSSILLTDALVGKFVNNYNQGPSVERHPPTGWGAPGPGKDFRNPSLSSMPGRDWHEKGGRPGWEQGAFGSSGTNRVNEGHFWGRNWASGHIADTDRRGPQASAELPQNAREGFNMGNWGGEGNLRGANQKWFDKGDPNWGAKRDANWGRDTNFRVPGNHRPDNPGNEGGFTKKKDVPCRYFARGMCMKGQSCDFQH